MKKSKVISIVICVILAIAFIFLTISVKKYGVLGIDNAFYNLFVLDLRNPLLTKIVIGITYIGSAYMYGLLFILGLIFLKNKKIPLYTIVGVLTSAGLMRIVKAIIQRPRPDGYRLIAETGFSFPSGHSLNAMVFYGFIIFLVYHFVKPKSLKIFLLILLPIIILSIGLSRVYLGVHYVSDIIGGYLFGLCFLILYTMLIKKIFPKEFE